MTGRNAHRIFVNSFPKSGTNLVEKLMRLLGLRQGGRSLASSSVVGRHSLLKRISRVGGFAEYTIPIGLELPVGVNTRWLSRYIRSAPKGCYISGHAAWSGYLDHILASENIKVIQIFRDPRAILSSMAQFTVEPENQWYPFHSVFKKMDRRELIKIYIRGSYISQVGMYYSGIREALSRAEGWTRSPNTLVVRFEDLVGERGGGSVECQYRTLETIVNFLDFGEADIKSIQNQLFGGTHTFRGGQVDRWKDDFDAELDAMISHELTGLPWLTELGYGFESFGK